MLTHLRAVESVLACPPCGLVLDVDGTIAPIVRRPADARVSPRCLKYMSMLLTPLRLLAVISGRPAREAKDMIGLDGLTYLGCHGLERLAGDHVVVEPGAVEYARRVQETAMRLAGRLSGRSEVEGLLLEDKGISVTFHYRLCLDPDLAYRAIIEALEEMAGLDGVRVMEARRAIELLPDMVGDKGTALLKLVTETGVRGAFYIGDDKTDLDALRAIRRRREEGGVPGLAVGVSGQETPPEIMQVADFTVSGVPGVERFLGLLWRLLG